MKFSLILLTLVPFLFKTCLLEADADAERVLLATVGSESIWLDEALESMPANFTLEDSSRFVNDYVSKRVMEQLLFEQAERNVASTEAIDLLVQEYRRSLLVYEYQQRILNEHMQDSFNEEDVRAYYERNPEHFRAVEPLVKGLFVRVPVSAPKLDEFKSLCRDLSASHFDRIESYSIKNASIYTIFVDRWIPLREFSTYLTLNNKQLDDLRRLGWVEVEDEQFYTLLTTLDVVQKGQPAPFEYVRATVSAALLNAQKKTFIQEFEMNLLKDAEKKGKVEYYY